MDFYDRRKIKMVPPVVNQQIGPAGGPSAVAGATPTIPSLQAAIRDAKSIDDLARLVSDQKASSLIDSTPALKQALIAKATSFGYETRSPNDPNCLSGRATTVINIIPNEKSAYIVRSEKKDNKWTIVQSGGAPDPVLAGLAIGIEDGQKCSFVRPEKQSFEQSAASSFGSNPFADKGPLAQDPSLYSTAHSYPAAAPKPAVVAAPPAPAEPPAPPKPQVPGTIANATPDHRPAATRSYQAPAPLPPSSPLPQPSLPARSVSRTFNTPISVADLDVAEINSNIPAIKKSFTKAPDMSSFLSGDRSLPVPEGNISEIKIEGNICTIRMSSTATLHIQGENGIAMETTRSLVPGTVVTYELFENGLSKPVRIDAPGKKTEILSYTPASKLSSIGNTGSFSGDSFNANVKPLSPEGPNGAAPPADQVSGNNIAKPIGSVAGSLISIINEDEALRDKIKGLQASGPELIVSFHIETDVAAQSAKLDNKVSATKVSVTIGRHVTSGTPPVQRFVPINTPQAQAIARDLESRVWVRSGASLDGLTVRDYCLNPNAFGSSSTAAVLQEAGAITFSFK